jgi:hypothetical protein
MKCEICGKRSKENADYYDRDEEWESGEEKKHKRIMKELKSIILFSKKMEV